MSQPLYKYNKHLLDFLREEFVKTKTVPLNIS